MGAFDHLIPQPGSARGAFSHLIPDEAPATEDFNAQLAWTRAKFPQLSKPEAIRTVAAKLKRSIPDDPTAFEAFTDTIAGLPGEATKSVIRTGLTAPLRLVSRVGQQFTGDSSQIGPKAHEAAPLERIANAVDDSAEVAFPSPEQPGLETSVAQGVGQVGTMLGGGAVLKGMGAGAKLIGGGMLAQMGASEFDDAFEASVARGDDADTAVAKALGYGTVAALIENRLGAGRLWRQMFPSAELAAKKLTGLGVSRAIGANILAGGAEEGLQRASQNLIVEEKPSMEGVVEEAIPGAIIEGAMGLPASVSTRVAQGRQFDAEKQLLEDSANRIALEQTIPTGAGVVRPATEGNRFEHLIPKASESQSAQSASASNTDGKQQTPGAAVTTPAPAGASPDQAAKVRAELQALPGAEQDLANEEGRIKNEEGDSSRVQRAVPALTAEQTDAGLREASPEDAAPVTKGDLKALVNFFQNGGPNPFAAKVEPKPTNSETSGQPDAQGKPPQTITGSNVQTGTAMPVPPQPAAVGGQAAGGATAVDFTAPETPAAQKIQIKAGDTVSVVTRAGAKPRNARVVQMQPDGSAQVVVAGEKTARMVNANQITPSRRAVTLQAKADELAGFAPEQQTQIKTRAAEFRQLVADYAPQLEWTPAEAYDESFGSDTKDVAFKKADLQRNAIRQAMRAVFPNGQENSQVDQANALPKLEAYLRQQFPGDNSVAKRRTLEEFGRSETPPQETAAVERDQATLDQLAARRPNQPEFRGLRAVGRSVPRGQGGLRQRGAGTGVLPSAGASTVTELERIFGVRIIFVENAPFNGVRIHGTNLVLISAKSPRATMAIAGHELLHHIKATHPGLYADFVAQARALLKNSEQFRAELARKGYSNLTEDVVTEEMFADVLGDAVLDPAFLQQLAKSEPNVFKRFARTAVKWLEKLIAKAKALTGFDSAQYVTDLTEMREQLLNLLREAGRQTQFRNAGIAENEEGGMQNEETGQFSRQRMQLGNATITAPGLVDMGDRFSLTAHHGTPHKVDKFTTAKIGTGEGAQVYGWGLYFAENEKVADNYAETLSDRYRDQRAREGETRLNEQAKREGLAVSWSDDRGRFYLRPQIAPGQSATYDPAAIEAKASETLRAAITQANASVHGNKYTVELNAEPQDLLDWDKPLSEQSEKVRKALGQTSQEIQEIARNTIFQNSGKFIVERIRPGARFTGGDRVGVFDTWEAAWEAAVQYYSNEATGQMLYSYRNKDAETASKELQKAGIKGIRFLDQGSRGQTDVFESGGKWYVVGDKSSKTAKEFATKKEADDYADSLPNRTYNYVIFSDDDITITHENGQEVGARDMFSLEGGDMFGFAAPESVGEQKQRIKNEKLKIQNAKAKEAMQERAGARLIGQDLDTTQEMFGAEVKRDKAGQGDMFSKEKAGFADGGDSGNADEVNDYHMSHRPRSDGPRAFDLLENDVSPRDIYEHPDYYTGEPGSIGFRESLAALRKVRGNPEAEITVYRAAPKKALNSGDWIALSKHYARQHGMADDPRDDIPVHSFKVKAKDVRWAGDSLEEFGYYPESADMFSREEGQSEFTKLQADITVAETELMTAIRTHMSPPSGMRKAEALEAKNDAHRKLRALLAQQLKLMTDIRNLDAARSPEETANLISQTVDLLNSIQDDISERTARSEAVPADLTKLRTDLQERLSMLKGWTDAQQDEDRGLRMANGGKQTEAGRARLLALESATDPQHKTFGEWWQTIKNGLRYLTSPIPELPLTGERAEKSALFRRGYRLFAVENNRVRKEAAERVNQVLEPLTKLGRTPASNEALRRYYQLGEARERAAMDPARREAITKQMLALEESTLNKDPFNLFRRLVLYKDLRWRGTYLKNDAGKPITLPLGLTVDEVGAELRRLYKLIENHPDGLAITEALRRHYTLTDDLQKSILEHGEIIPESLRNPLYFPHHVIDSWSGNIARVRPSTEEDFRKYLIAPTGSAKLIQTDYLKAMYLHTADVLAHNARVDLVDKYWKPYDISEQLKAQHGDKWNLPWNIPPGYKIFTPFNKLPLRMDYVLSREVLADKLGILFNDGDLRERMGDTGRVLKVKPEDLHAAMVAGEKIQWALPAEIADALTGIARREAAASNPGLGHKLGLPFRAVNNFWKKTKLFAPWNWIRYEYGNLSTDAIDKVLAADPGAAKYLGRAAREVWGSGDPGHQATPEFKAAAREGVFDTITAGEAGELTKLPEFKAFLTGNEARWDKVRSFLERPMRGSKFREATFRYAKFLADVERLRAGKEPTYAGAFHGDIEALGEDVDGQRRMLEGDELIYAKAAEISLKTYGDYNSLGVAGQWLRQYAVPFWSWQDVNFRYHANQLRNIADGLLAGDRQHINTARKAALRYAGVRVVSTLVAIGIAKELWNQFGGPLLGLWDDDDDLESKLSEQDRRRGHLLLGKDKDGKVKVVYTPSAWSDVAEWMGGQNMKRLFMEYARGQITLDQFVTDYAKQLPGDVLNKLAQSVGPLGKAPYETISGKSTFPDVLDQRTIPESERWWRLVGTLTDDRAVNVLRSAFDQDYYSQPATEQLQQIILQIRRRDPEQWSYYEAREDAAEWKEAKTGKRFEQGSYDAPEAQALRNFRKSIYRGDVASAERFYGRLLAFGYTSERLDASIRNQHPLSDLNEKERAEYVKTLTAKQKQELELATKYYQKLKALDGRERQLFPRKGQKASPKPELLKRIVEDQSRNK